MAEWKFGSRRIQKFIEVHLTPKMFFAKIIRPILLSNLVQNFFELVKSLNFMPRQSPSK